MNSDVVTYPDTVREDNTDYGDGFTLHIQHNDSLLEISLFYNEDQMELQYFILNELFDSVRTTWYENGNIECQAAFEKGYNHGWDRCWNRDGTLYSESLYRNDTVIQGTHIQTDEFGYIEYIEMIENEKVISVDSSSQGMHAIQTVFPPN